MDGRERASLYKFRFAIIIEEEGERRYSTVTLGYVKTHCVSCNSRVNRKRRHENA
jgi:hypothetical protein